MSFHPYPEYKDSGVEWLGGVPVHWGMARLSRFAKTKGGGTPPKDELRYWDGSVPWVTPKDMKQERLRDTQTRITEEGVYASPASWIEPGHVLLVVRSGILRHHLPSAINEVSLTVNQDIRAFDVTEKLEAEYFHGFIQGPDYVPSSAGS